MQWPAGPGASPPPSAGRPPAQPRAAAAPAATAGAAVGDLPPVPPPLPPEWSEALGLARGDRAPGPPPPVDRRASAALEPPSVDQNRRNAVALSLAGLFDDLEMPDPTAPPAPSASDGAGQKKPRSTPEAWSNDDPKEEAAPAHARPRGLRALFTPAGFVALAAVCAALFIVGYFVSKADPPKPPGDQVTTVAHR